MHDISKATHLDVEAGVRYWEDATVNGAEEDDDDPTIYGAHQRSEWRVRINLAEGRIEGWPADMAASIHYKVCDEGEYWLSDADGKRLAKWRDYYVPSEYLCHGGAGYGDYIVLDVEPGGLIKGYEKPALDYESWEVLS